jgi:hypothetical protein
MPGLVETVGRTQLSADLTVRRSCSINTVIHSGVLITQKFRFFLIGWRLFTGSAGA